MLKPVTLAATVAVAFAMPAWSATTAPRTYFVAQNVKTMNCIVTPTKPNGTTYVMIGSMTFTAVSTAMKDMRSEDACKNATNVALKTTTKTTSAPASSAGSPPPATPATPAPSAGGY